ncbi:MAG: hypothetical protein JNJ54_30050 [Myxococcaceae bacterium]|nr:hypothetical protein [Myxococcaceae bacterium]
MTTRLAVLVSLSLLSSACGPELTDPTITLSPTDATLIKRGSTWVFVSPVQYTWGTGATQTRFSARVKEQRGGFLVNPEGQPKNFFDIGLPNPLELPLDAKPSFPVGTEVVLTLEVMALSWDGVTNQGVAMRTQNYSFIQR